MTQTTEPMAFHDSPPAPAFAIYPSLSGRVVLVTGGASGIGEAIVEAFAHQNARVAFLDIQAEVGQAVAACIAADRLPPPIFYPCDLTDIGSLQQTVSRIGSDLGSIDVLINNADNDARHTLASVTPESWDRTMALNLKHQFFAAQAAVPFMKAAQRGSIVNMSSISWIIPSTGLPGYVTAKAAIVGLTRTLAHELGPDNIRVNAVLPGAILTKRQKELWFTKEYEAEVLNAQALKRILLPEEVARLILFLAADDSSAITNQSYVIDGGWV